MKLSKSFVKTKKQISQEEKSINAQLLQKGGFINQSMAGVFTYLPLGLKVLRKIQSIITQEMEKTGAEEILMPALQSKQVRVQTDRWDSLDVLFRFTSFYTHKELALGSTHEEVVTPLLKEYVFSYKDLPRYVFQIQNKFRDELRAKSGILRAREFLMKDLYSFHTSQNDLDEYYELVNDAYKQIFSRVGIIDKTYKTYARGGAFSKYSHEYQTQTLAGEDLIYICDKCKIAVNKELLDEQSVCPECGEKSLREEKAVEVGNIFKLGTKFSSAFDFNYIDENGEKQPIIMGCYGIGLGRLLGTIVELSHDEKGIVWPESVAPYKYIVIGIGDLGIKKAEQIYEYMNEKGFEVVLDDRNESVGYKFKDADLIGYPKQIVVSDKTLQLGENIVELIDRKTGNKIEIDYFKI